MWALVDDLANIYRRRRDRGCGRRRRRDRCRYRGSGGSRRGSCAWTCSRADVQIIRGRATRHFGIPFGLRLRSTCILLFCHHILFFGGSLGLGLLFFGGCLRHRFGRADQHIPVRFHRHNFNPQRLHFTLGHFSLLHLHRGLNFLRRRQRLVEGLNQRCRGNDFLDIHIKNLNRRCRGGLSSTRTALPGAFVGGRRRRGWVGFSSIAFSTRISSGFFRPPRIFRLSAGLVAAGFLFSGAATAVLFFASPLTPPHGCSLTGSHHRCFATSRNLHPPLTLQKHKHLVSIPIDTRHKSCSGDGRRHPSAIHRRTAGSGRGIDENGPFIKFHQPLLGLEGKGGVGPDTGDGGVGKGKLSHRCSGRAQFRFFKNLLTGMSRRGPLSLPCIVFHNIFQGGDLRLLQLHCPQPNGSKKSKDEKDVENFFTQVHKILPLTD